MWVLTIKVKRFVTLNKLLMNPSVSSLSLLLESGDLNGEQLDTQNMLQQICSIVDIIDRDHMKVWTIVDIIDRDHMKVWTS